MTQQRIDELRARANRLRESAARADNRAAYNDDMATAAKYDDEADELADKAQDRLKRKPSGFPPADKDIDRPFGLPYPSGQKI
ncbi:hypothetical protein [Methylomonas rosea]|uniref:Uncharacterized protein n=1 Tax=Methylomonas rosea TaxID=2952227 RepID=A0ABT1TMW3_9GAMM|nr:hypothetical protein [Methylomonas sp. WSC-7]MCQ8116112.1 hypothetical protein [Methylomonas sp. WSC-7]